MTTKTDTETVQSASSNTAAVRRRQDLYKRLLPYLITAILSTTIGIIIFKINKVAPFGEKTVLCMDLWGQYFSMYVNNKNAGFSEMFHSWNGAFGFNNWAQNAYYCNSPFLLLMKFIPYKYMVKALDIFCLAKIVLSSLTFLAAMQYKCKERSPIFVGGAVCYSFCAYMIAFISQFMWTDALVLTPLVVIGLEKLIHEKKPLFYTLTLAYTVITSFYIGFAVCIFSVLYFAANSVQLISIEKTEERKRLKGIPDFYGAIARFSVYSLVAGALSAFVTIPVASAISKTLSVDEGAPKPEKLEWYGNVTGVLQNALPGKEFFQEYAGMNIYCGILIFLAIPLYFANKEFRLLERIANGCLLGFLVLSMNCNYLNYMWHGLHFPNQLPGRWSFLFSFYAVMLSCRGLCKHSGLTLIRTAIGTAVGSLGLFLTSKGMGSASGYKVAGYAKVVFITAAAVLLANAVVSFVLARKDAEKTAGLRKLTAQCCAVVIAGLMSFDMCRNLITVCDYEGNKGFQGSMEKGYSDQIVKFNEKCPKVASGSDDFYRTEAVPGFTFNPSMMGDYNSLGYYSSTMDGNVFSLLKFMGNRVYGDKVSSVYNISSPVQNGLFGIKNYIDFGGYLTSKLPGTVENSELSEKIGTNVRSNTTPLPVAFAVADTALDYEVTDQVLALKNQNDLVSALCGEEAGPYIRVEPDNVDPKTVSFYPDQDLNSSFYVRNDGEEVALIDYIYTAPADGFYFFEHNYRAGELKVTGINIDKTVNTGDGAFAFVGYLGKGEQLKIEFKAENVGVGCYGLNLYYMNEHLWDDDYHKLLDGGLSVTKASGTRIKGDIELSSSSLVMATIAQDGGWTAYCDGEKLEMEKVAGVFPCFRVPEGKHTIELRYRVPGLIPGTIIAVFGLGALIALMFYEKKLRKKAAAEAEELRVKAEEAEKSAETESEAKAEKEAASEAETETKTDDKAEAPAKKPAKKKKPGAQNGSNSNRKKSGSKGKKRK